MNKSNIIEYLLAEIDDLADEFSEIDENGLHSERWCGIIDARQIIINAPFISDRPQGEWIDKGWKGDWQFETDGRGNCWKVFECSVCNGWNTRKTCFCPHCGAKMKGADDE